MKEEWPNENQGGDQVVDTYEVPFYPRDLGGWQLERYRFMRLASGEFQAFSQAGDRMTGGSRTFPIPKEMLAGSYEAFADAFVEAVPPCEFGLSKEEILGDGQLKAFLGFTERKPHPEVIIVTLPEMQTVGKWVYCRGNEHTKFKEDEDPAKKDWYRELWADVMAKCHEAPVSLKRGSDGSFPSFWGIMDDSASLDQAVGWTAHFKEGYYYAAVETDACVSRLGADWCGHTIKGGRYAVLDVTPETQDEVFFNYINVVLPEMGLRVTDAVCEKVRPGTDEVTIYIPVKEG